MIGERRRVALSHGSFCRLFMLSLIGVLAIGCQVDEEREPEDVIEVGDVEDDSPTDEDAVADTRDSDTDAVDATDASADDQDASDPCEGAWDRWHGTECDESLLGVECDIENVPCNNSDESGDGWCACIDGGPRLEWLCRPHC